jgi:hypothetical protein
MLRRRFGTWDSPWREMERLRREMNYLFDRSSAGFGEGTAPDCHR